MKYYNIKIANQVYTSLGDIFKHKSKYDEYYATTFAEGCLNDLKNLSYFPHRGFNLTGKYKARIYENHLVIYTINEPDEVLIIDIVDPRQHTIANKYY